MPYLDDDTILIGLFESPKTLKQIKKLRKEFKKMSVSLDRLNASIDALSAKVDEHIAGDIPAGGATEAEVNMAADKVDAIKAKFDGVPAPVEPMPADGFQL